MPRRTYDNRDKNLAMLPLVTEVEGIKIHIEAEDGSFWARVGRDIVSRKNLADMKRLISQRTKSITVLVIGQAEHSGYEPDLTVLEIVGVEKTRGNYDRDVFKYRRKDGDLIEAFRIHAYPFDATTHDLFKVLMKEYADEKRAHDEFREVWRKRWDAEAAKLTKLTPEQIKEMRERTADTEIAEGGAIPFSKVPDDDD